MFGSVSFLNRRILNFCILSTHSRGRCVCGWGWGGGAESRQAEAVCVGEGRIHTSKCLREVSEMTQSLHLLNFEAQLVTHSAQALPNLGQLHSRNAHSVNYYFIHRNYPCAASAATSEKMPASQLAHCFCDSTLQRFCQVVLPLSQTSILLDVASPSSYRRLHFRCPGRNDKLHFQKSQYPSKMSLNTVPLN